MSDPTVQSLADQIQALTTQLQALKARIDVHSTNINEFSELSRTFSSQLANLGAGIFGGDHALRRVGDQLVINPDQDYDDEVLVDSGLNITDSLDVGTNISAGGLLTNKISAVGSGLLEITTPQLRLRASDLILNGRTTGNGRALVDEGNQLFVNFNRDYFDGTVIGSSLFVNNNINLVGSDIRHGTNSADPNSFVTFIRLAGNNLQFIPEVGFDVVTIFGDLNLTGSVNAQGGDIAEQFDVAAEACADPGTVMVVGDDGKLEPCTRAHDSRAAGVIAGAGGLKTAMLLNQQDGHRAAIALVGSAYCKCDAAYGPIAAGDLLTTSASLGHAMRVDNANANAGTIIGKALQPLPSGSGLIPILVVLR